MITRFTESLVEQAALDWLAGLGYSLAPGEPARPVLASLGSETADL